MSNPFFQRATGGPIRIAYFMDYFHSPQGGTESQLLALLRGLDRTRFEPSVYLLRAPDALTAVVPEVPVRMLQIRSLMRIGTAARLAVLVCRLRLRGVRLAHLYLNDVAVILPWMLRIVGIKPIVSRRDLGFWHTPMLRRILRFQRPAVAAVVTNSESVRTFVMEAEGYMASQVRVISNGKETAPSTWSRAQARASIGCDTRVPVLLVVANLRPLKRTSDVVAALPAIREKFPATQLILAGADSDGVSGPSHAAELCQQAEQLGVAAGLKIAGAVTEPARYIAAADVCLLCSETEGLSNSLIEYMLGERPVVCTRVGGNPELVQHTETGLLVDVGRPDQIAQAVLSHLQDPAKAASMARAARQSALARFSMQSMIDAHESLYVELGGRS